MAMAMQLQLLSMDISALLGILGILGSIFECSRNDEHLRNSRSSNGSSISSTAVPMWIQIFLVSIGCICNVFLVVFQTQGFFFLCCVARSVSAVCVCVCVCVYTAQI
jgi:ABC-type multidrug transport system permease subunit